MAPLEEKKSGFQNYVDFFRQTFPPLISTKWNRLMRVNLHNCYEIHLSDQSNNCCVILSPASSALWQHWIMIMSNLSKLSASKKNWLFYSPIDFACQSEHKVYNYNNGISKCRFLLNGTQNVIAMVVMQNISTTLKGL